MNQAVNVLFRGGEESNDLSINSEIIDYVITEKCYAGVKYSKSHIPSRQPIHQSNL